MHFLGEFSFCTVYADSHHKTLVKVTWRAIKIILANTGCNIIAMITTWSNGHGDPLNLVLLSIIMMSLKRFYFKVF